MKQDETSYYLAQMLEFPDFKMYNEPVPGYPKAPNQGYIFECGEFKFDGSALPIQAAVFQAYIYLKVKLEIKNRLDGIL